MFEAWYGHTPVDMHVLCWSGPIDAPLSGRFFSDVSSRSPTNTVPFPIVTVIIIETEQTSIIALTIPITILSNGESLPHHSSRGESLRPIG